MAGTARHPRVRKRMVITFLVAVLLPCLFLSYVGLKSIKQEKQSQRELLVQNLKSSLTLTLDRIESSFEDQIRTAFLSIQSSVAQSKTFSYSSLRRFSTQDQLVENIFILDKDLRLIFPRTFRDKSTPEPKPRKALRPTESDALRNGEVFESQGEFDKAIAESEKGLSGKRSRHERMALLLRLARCYFKKNDFVSAQAAYQKLIEEDRHEFYGEELPYVVIAYQQRIAIIERSETASSRFTLLLDFYTLLLENFYRLERAQYSFYVDQVKSKLSAVQRLLKSRDSIRFSALQAEEKEVEREVTLSQELQSTLIPEMSGIVDVSKTDRQVHLVSFMVNNTLRPIAYQTKTAENGSPYIIVLKMRKEAIDNFLYKNLEPIQVGEGIKAAFAAPDGEIIQPTKVSTFETVLKTPFFRLEKLLPGYTLDLVATEGNPLESLAEKSLLIYYILVFSVITMIAVGIVFIFRYIAREEQLSEMKSEFIANVSHEIKTPIATIRTLAENLNEGWVIEFSKQKDYFRLMAREAERLSHLVSNILDFSRIEAKRKMYRREIVPITEVIEKSLERFRLQIEGQGVTIVANVDRNLPQVNIDPEAIEQSILNLLDNAIKYSRDDKFIKISAQARGDSVVVQVIDHGIGIEKKEIPRLFEKFYRVESDKGKKVAGSGIGLTIVKEIIEAHGGSIEVESERERGSTFSLHLPIHGE